MYLVHCTRMDRVIFLLTFQRLPLDQIDSSISSNNFEESDSQHLIFSTLFTWHASPRHLHHPVYRDATEVK